MPKAAQHHALARQWQLLRLLPSRAPGITSRALAAQLEHAGFPVTKRTVERDLAELATLFGIVCNDKGTPYGWHWMKGEFADLPGQTLADAVSMQLVESLLRPLLPAAVLESLESRFQQARDKLATLTRQDTARWPDKVCYVAPALPLRAPEIDKAILQNVQDALLHQKQLLTHYRNASEAPDSAGNELRLHPLGLIQRGPITYLAATAFAYTDIRLYAVHRMSQATMLDEAAHAPEGFNLPDYLASGAAHFGSGESLRVTARISPEVAQMLTETPLADDQQITDRDGKLRLCATLEDSWQLHWWILSQGAGFIVEQPPMLRAAIRQQLAAAQAAYASNEEFACQQDSASALQPISEASPCA